MILTKEDCIKFDKPLFLGEGFCVLSTDAMKEEYKSDMYQLITCGGFAANPDTIAAHRGSGVFVSWVIDDDHSRYELCYILGIAKPETVARWLQEYHDKIHHYTEESQHEMTHKLEEYSKLTEEELVARQEKHYNKETN